MEAPCCYNSFGAFGEEFLADRLACKWGFFEGLKQERLISYGQAYVNALKKWQDEKEYCIAMEEWHLRKLIS